MKIKGHKIMQRRYPSRDWEYKAVAIRILDDNGKAKDVIYSISKDKGKESVGVEIYAGRNYIVGSHDSNYTRRYKMCDVPVKYADAVQKAIKIHKKTKWLTAKRVDKN